MAYYKNNREDKLKYLKEYYYANKDDISQYNKEKYQKYRDEYLEYQKQYNKQNRETYLEYQRSYYYKHSAERKRRIFKISDEKYIAEHKKKFKRVMKELLKTTESSLIAYRSNNKGLSKYLLKKQMYNDYDHKPFHNIKKTDRGFVLEW